MSYYRLGNSKVSTKALKSFSTFWVIALRNLFYASFGYLLFLTVMLIETSFRHMSVATGIIVFLIPAVFIYWMWKGILKEHTKVKIYADKIVVEKTFGRKHEFHILELNNYRTDNMVGFRGSRHEYLFIIKNDMEVTIISAFNHCNYRRMKDEIDKNLVAAKP